MSTLLGFDYGTRKIGIAVGQTITGSASPLATVRARGGQPDWTAIGRLIQEWCPVELVVGMPLNMDGTDAEPAPQARRFARQLEGRFRLPVHLADERLTTSQALSEVGHSVQHTDELDAYAAKLILETWLRD